MRYKFFLLLFIILSCSKKPIKNIEIRCPYQAPILVKFASINDLKNSIVRNIKQGSNNMVVFKFKDDRILSLKIKSAEFRDCKFMEYDYGQIDRNYIHSF